MTSLASYYTKAQTRGNWQSRVVIGKNGGQGRAGRDGAGQGRAGQIVGWVGKV